MAPNPTSRLRLIKQETYSNPDAWGAYLNDGGLEMADEGFGIAEIEVGSNITLDAQNFVTDEARKLVLILDGAGGFAVTAPAVDKPYLVVNDCSADVTMGPFGGTFDTIRAGTACWYITNADASVGRFLDATLDKIKAPVAPVDFGGQRAVNGEDGVDPTDFATMQQIAPFADAAAQSAANALLSELATQALYDDFQKRYLGPHATPPTEDELGNPVEEGALYFDTVVVSMFVYNGVNWSTIDAVSFATKEQAEAGTATGVAMDPLRTADAIAALQGYHVFTDVFTSSGAWNKRQGAKHVYVMCIGAGGGAASGVRAGSNEVRYGGGGGGGGAVSERSMPAALCAASETVTVGAGGAGGASRTVSGAGVVNPGAGGGQTSFGALVVSNGGAGAVSVTGAGAAGGNAHQSTNAIFQGGASPVWGGSNGGNGSGSTSGTTGSSSIYGGGGGGGGGAVSGSNVNQAATAGGRSGRTTAGGGGAAGTTGTNGTNGEDGVTLLSAGGGGGGGNGGTGGNGGNGGTGAGGGGGGGSTLNSGAGGSGGDGLCVVITFAEQ